MPGGPAIGKDAVATPEPLVLAVTVPLWPVRLNVTGVPLGTGPPVARSWTVADTVAEPPCAADVAPV